MAALDALVRQVRNRLGSPSRAHLSDGQVLQFLYDRIQLYMSQLRNRGNEGQYLKRFPLVVSAGTDTYPLGAHADFAGAFLVTTDPDVYGDHREREIQVVRIQDLDLVTGSGAYEDRTGTSPDSVVAIAFYSDGAQWYAKAAPRGASGSYRVWYEPDAIAETALENRPVLPASFHPMLAAATALDSLALCKWDGMTEEGEARKCDMLASTQGAFVRACEREWDTYVRLANAQHTEFREPYSSTPGFWRGGYRGGGGW